MKGSATYYSLSCTDSPCDRRIPFGQHKGNRFSDLAESYLPLARAYTLSAEIAWKSGAQRDAVVSHLHLVANSLFLRRHLPYSSPGAIRVGRGERHLIPSWSRLTGKTR